MPVGTKVTNDPAAKDHPITEGAGLITSDSLAAESSAFQQRNPLAAPSKQPSKSTTSNTTDTSAARALAPAADAEARQAEEAWSETKILNEGRQGGAASGKGGAGVGRNGSGTLSGPGTGSGVVKAVELKSDGGGAGSGAEQSGDGRGDADQDGFDGANASFGDVDIGGENDPGRVAERTMFERNAQFGLGSGIRGGGLEAEKGQYDDLEDTDA